MISRRVATFLLGIWIGCGLLVDLLAIQTNRTADRFLDNPGDRGGVLFEADKKENAAILLHHVSREQIRVLLGGWELAQLGLAAGIGILLIFSDQRKLVSILMCSAMAAITASQAFLITPSWTDLGRELDFVVTGSVVTITRVAMLMQTYGILEVVKLLIGGGLASYFFMMESTVRRSHRSRGGSRAQEAVVAAPVKPS